MESKRGKLYFIYGTMGSAKTALLLTKAYNFEEKGISFICIKPSIDTREATNVIKSRIGIERECIFISPEESPISIAKSHPGLEWIIIDEAQFLTEKQVDELSWLADYEGISILCYGLRTDFQTKLFPGSKRLMEIADTIEEIKSTCNCGAKSLVNARFDSFGNIVTNGSQVEIGGNDKYSSICRKCWNNLRTLSIINKSFF